MWIDSCLLGDARAFVVVLAWVRRWLRAGVGGGRRRRLAESGRRVEDRYSSLEREIIEDTSKAAGGVKICDFTFHKIWVWRLEACHFVISHFSF